jgi:hypothetical protein
MKTKYKAISYINSNNSIRRGLVRRDRKTGEIINVTTYQIVRSNDPDASDLPHRPTVGRSKYMPHVGRKQLSKQHA